MHVAIAAAHGKIAGALAARLLALGERVTGLLRRMLDVNGGEDRIEPALVAMLE